MPFKVPSTFEVCASLVENFDTTGFDDDACKFQTMAAAAIRLLGANQAALSGVPQDDMPLVIIESPLHSRVSPSLVIANQEYARRAMRDSLARGECPFASHLLYAQPGILDDEVPDEREKGIAAGLAWGRRATRTVVYFDRGVSPGMRRGIADARGANREIVWRSLDGTPLQAGEAIPGDVVEVA